MTHEETFKSLSESQRELVLEALLSAVDAGGGERLRPRAGERGWAPLSYAQQRLWVLEQLTPGTSTYTVTAGVRLQGAVHVEALSRSLTEVVRRHESLRTRFALVGDEARQVIEPPQPVMLAVETVADEAAAHAVAREEGETPFDLLRGPLCRMRLLRWPDAYALLVTTHHIVTDHWSLGILVDEVQRLYAAYTAGEASPLPALPIQYGDYAAWQRTWLRGPVLEAQLAYWREQLAGLATLALPVDYARPAVVNYRGGREHFRIGPAVTTQMQAVSQAAGTTVFMTLLASFQAVLARLSGQDDIAIGVPIAGRTRAEVEGLIGFFVNTLVLRTRLDGNPTFSELLARVREVTLGAYAHQELPFERLVEELQPERDLSRNPLFQVAFAFQNTPATSLRLAGVEVQSFAIETGRTKFDLTVLLAETPGGVQGLVEYRTDLWQASTIQRLLAQWERLLAGAVTQPAQRVWQLPLLSAAERATVVTAPNQTARGYAAGTLHGLFEAQVARQPEAVALVEVDGVRTQTYAALEARANQVAHALRARGVGPEVVVGVCLPRSGDLVVALLGILKAGGAYLPLDPAWPAARVTPLLDTLAVPVVLTTGPVDAAPAAPLGAVGRTVVALETIEGPTTPVAGSVDPDALAYVIFTSGSSGRPKGVRVRHRAVSNLIDWVTRTFAIGPGDRGLSLASACFDLSVYDVFGLLAAGASLRMVREADVRDPATLLRILETEPVTFWDSAPAALQQLAPWLGAPRRDAALRLVFLSGDWIPVALPDQVRRTFPRADVIGLGGATEATVWSNVYRIGRVDPTWPSIPYGRPIQNSRYYVLDAWLAPVAAGVAGALYIGGDCLCDGYAQEPALTGASFVPDPFGPTGGRLYRTGDLARWRADGQLEFLGRRDHQVKIRGFRIEVGEIEAALRTHPHVREAVVEARAWLAPAGAGAEKRLIAYLVPAAGTTVTPEALKQHLRTRLPEYMMPAHWVSLATLPVTANGKLDRRALPAPVVADAGEEYVAPATARETTLAAIWAEVLRVPRVGRHDNFFDLGGDSILSIQVVARAAAAGIPVTPAQVFRFQTIAELAAAEATAPAVAVAPVVIDAPVPLTPIQRWFLAQPLPDRQHWNQAVLLRVDTGLSADAWRTLVQALLTHHDALRLRLLPPAPGAANAADAADAADGADATDAADAPDAADAADAVDAADAAGAAAWRQVQGDLPAVVPFEVIDLRAVAPDAQAAAITAAATRLQSSLDLAAGPLLRVAYVSLGGAAGDRLLVIVHHLAVDGVSWRILLEDLQTGARQLQQGGTVQWAAKTSAFQQWARALAAHATSPAIAAERDYWTQVLAGRAPLPRDVAGAESANREGAATTCTWTHSRVQTTQLLREGLATWHAQIPEVLLTVVGEALATWSGRRDVWIELEGHGREDLGVAGLDVSRTVGWFTTLFPVHLTLAPAGAPIGDSLQHVKTQWRQIPGRGLGYGLLHYGPSATSGATATHATHATPATPATQATPAAPEVLFNYLGQFDQVLHDDGSWRAAPESAGPTRSPAAPRAYLLEITTGISDGQLHWTWTYCPHVHHAATIERLAAQCAAALERLLATSPTDVLPSDFPLIDLTAAQLEQLSGLLDEGA